MQPFEPNIDLVKLIRKATNEDINQLNEALQDSRINEDSFTDISPDSPREMYPESRRMAAESD